MAEKKQKAKSFDSGLYNGNRMPFVLNPANVPIDSRDLPADLKYLRRLSSLITFFDNDGKPEGDWSYFISEFGKDAIEQFSKEKAQEIKDATKEFDKLLNSGISQEEKTEILIRFFWHTIDLITPIYELLVNSSLQPRPTNFEGIGEALLLKIPETLGKIWVLSGLGADSSNREKIQKAYQRYSEIYYQLTGNYPLTPLAPPIVNTGSAITDEQVYQIKIAFDEIYRFAVAFSVFVEKNILGFVNPEESGQPFYALILSFFGRIQELRKYLNTLTKKHLDFYYNDVLELGKKTGQPDSTFVIFGLKQGLPSFLLPKGTELMAGKDALSHDLIYQTDRDLQISSAQISNLFNLFVDRKFSKTEQDSSGQPLSFVNGIYSNMNPLIGSDGLPLSNWPLLGCPVINTNYPNTAMKEAELGFSLASSEFFLASGQREVNIRFYVNEEPEFKSLIRFILDLKGPVTENNIYKLFYKAFRLSITGAEGWIPVGYTFKYNPEKYYFDISFSLTISDPSIVAYSEEVHLSGYKTSLPVLRFLLNTHDAPYFAYSFVQALSVTRIVISVSVQQITDALLFSPDGKLAPGKPFAPFGATPDYGASLMIGCSEAFSKKLDTLCVRIDWSNLPLAGFPDYYTGYPNPPANEAFQVGISLLQNGSFVPAKNTQQQFPLFISNPASTDGQSLFPFTEFNSINLQLLRQTPDWTMKPLPDYAPGVSNGYLRLELLQPGTGFGSSEYASALTQTITQNMVSDGVFSKILSKLFPGEFPPKEPLPLPQPPFTPEAYSVKIAYTSSIDTNRLPATGADNPQFQLFQNNPFGTVSMVTQEMFTAQKLLPDFQDEGYLFIGINELKQPCPLSLFFNLTGESYFTTEDLVVLNWRYLSTNGWEKFEKEKIINDGTESFIRPGIVDLSIPSDIVNTDQRMPGTDFWLSVSVKENSKVISPAVSIATQAVTVTWKNEENDPHHLDNPLPAGSIISFRKQSDSVQSILQPLASTGGVPPEHEHAFYMRVSERLSHKKRASLPVDFERIIFQEFESLYMVRCFPSAKYLVNEPEPGNVLIILVDKNDRSDLHDLLSPKSDIALNTRVSEFIGDYCSPGIAVHVHNPVYEEVNVCCTVKFKSEYDSGVLLGKLNHDLARFIAPWMYDDAENVRMGEVLSTSEMIGYIIQLPYVEFVTGLSIEVSVCIDDFFSLRDTAQIKFASGPSGENLPGEEIEALFPWSVFVSAASHRIQLAGSDNPRQPDRRGIGNLQIADDFILQYSPK